jgi:hypothetical protein
MNDALTILGILILVSLLLWMRPSRNKRRGEPTGLSTEQLGYIPSDTAVRMAAEMDGIKEFYAFISQLTGGTSSKPTRGVNIDIYVRQSRRAVDA